MKKRLFSLLLTMLLLLQLLPFAAAAGTVSFRLIGADKKGNYIVWIPEDTYAVSKFTTVGDVLKEAADKAGLKLTGLETDYISAITAPEALGGYKMSEFTNGANSGWMYTLNGKHPGYSVNTRSLKDGDVVIFHYVNDYLYEVEDWSGGYSLGTEEDWNGWLDADDSWLHEDEPEEEQKPSEEEQKPSEEQPSEEQQPSVSADAQDVVSAISDLTVKKANKTTRKRLENLESAYEALTQDEMAQVTNYESLVSLRDRFDELLEEALDEAMEELEDYDKDDYTKGQWDEIEPLLDEAEEDLEDAEDTDELDDILDDVKKDISQISGEAEAEKEDAVSFTDVAQSDWHYEHIAYAVSEGLFNGTSDDTFSPNAPMTRGMLVTVLHRLAGEPDGAAVQSFDDVEQAAWYTQAVSWAASCDIVGGYGNGLFGTNDSITREQLAVILHRYAAKQLFDVSASADLGSFTDLPQAASYAVSALQWAVAEGLLSGRTADTLAPKDSATRAEVAAILHRFAENF